VKVFILKSPLLHLAALHAGTYILL